MIIFYAHCHIAPSLLKLEIDSGDPRLPDSPMALETRVERRLGASSRNRHPDADQNQQIPIQDGRTAEAILVVEWAERQPASFDAVCGIREQSEILDDTYTLSPSVTALGVAGELFVWYWIVLFRGASLRQMILPVRRLTAIVYILPPDRQAYPLLQCKSAVIPGEECPKGTGAFQTTFFPGPNSGDSHRPLGLR